MKNVTIVHADTGQYDDVALMPGTTSGDVMDQLGIDDRFVLSPGRGQEPLGNTENLYESVPDGAKLWAVTPQTVGSGGSSPHSHNFNLNDFIRKTEKEIREFKPQFPKIEIYNPYEEKESSNDPLKDYYKNFTLPKVELPKIEPISIPPIVREFPRYESSPAVVPRKVVNKPTTERVVRKVIKPKGILIKRREIPYWQERGWKKIRKGFEGFYRTRFGSFQGKVEEKLFSKIDFYIHKPPKVLRNHDEWVCFNPRSRDWYFIHIIGGAKDKELSSGIIFIERILTEAYENEN